MWGPYMTLGGQAHLDSRGACSGPTGVQQAHLQAGQATPNPVFRIGTAVRFSGKSMSAWILEKEDGVSSRKKKWE